MVLEFLHKGCYRATIDPQGFMKRGQTRPLLFFYRQDVYEVYARNR